MAYCQKCNNTKEIFCEGLYPCPKCNPEAIECQLKQLQAELKKTNQWYCDQRDARLLLQAKLVELEVELEKHRWIPVSERLPDDINVKFVLLKKDRSFGPYAIRAMYSPTLNKWDHLSNMNGVITHWKPIFLPEKS